MLNLRSYNTTVDGAGLVPLPRPSPPRGSREYVFRLPPPTTTTTTKGGGTALLLPVRRLMANGSDAITGVTWDGWSYSVELDGGRSVRLANVTVGETVVVGQGGEVRLSVPDSSAAVVEVAAGVAASSAGGGVGAKLDV